MQLSLTQPLACDPYRVSAATGAFILIDRLTNNTVGAGMILEAGGGRAPARVSFAGVLVGALFVVPPMVSGTGALLARLVPGDAGAAVKLAAVNGVRNPRRTTSTAVPLTSTPSMTLSSRRS